MTDANRPTRIAVACVCGRRLTVRAELAGTRGRCPSCGALVDVPTLEQARSAAAAGPARPRVGRASDARAAPRADATGSTCAICQTALGADEPAVGCRVCDLPYHAECWGEYGGCAAYGCQNAPKQEDKQPEDPRKECPFCGESIPAKALRCPSCRERFEDARPVDRDQFISDLVHEPKRRALRAKAAGLLAAALLPCLGPVILVLGIVWLRTSPAEFEDAGGIYKVMVGTAASMGGIHTALLVLFVLGLVTS